MLDHLPLSDKALEDLASALEAEAQADTTIEF